MSAPDSREWWREVAQVLSRDYAELRAEMERIPVVADSFARRNPGEGLARCGQIAIGVLARHDGKKQSAIERMSAAPAPVAPPPETETPRP